MMQESSYCGSAVKINFNVKYVLHEAYVDVSTF